jgi:hypothetical protein
MIRWPRRTATSAPAPSIAEAGHDEFMESAMPAASQRPGTSGAYPQVRCYGLFRAMSRSAAGQPGGDVAGGPMVMMCTGAPGSFWVAGLVFPALRRVVFLGRGRQDPQLAAQYRRACREFSAKAPSPRHMTNRVRNRQGECGGWSSTAGCAASGPAWLRGRWWSGGGGQEVAGGTDQQGKFAALRLGGDGVAGHRGGKAALRADGQPPGINQRACLGKPGLDLFQRLDPRALGGDQAQHHHLAVGDQPQRLEGARAFIVVFQRSA